MRFLRLPVCRISLCVCVLAAAASQLAAQEFRVETSVFAAGGNQPLATNLTLFTGNMAYDFPQASSETIVFDPANQRFVLLNTRSRQRTELNLEALGAYVAAVKRQGIEKKQELLYDPQFKTDYSAEAHRLTIESDAITYRTDGIVPPENHAAAVATYRQFTDWSARLNTTRKGSFPPFGRLVLNAELQNRKLLPELIEFQYTPPGAAGDAGDAGDKAVFQSRHKFAWKLTDDDRRRIEQASRNVLDFTPLEPREYLENRP